MAYVILRQCNKKNQYFLKSQAHAFPSLHRLALGGVNRYISAKNCDSTMYLLFSVSFAFEEETKKKLNEVDFENQRLPKQPL